MYKFIFLLSCITGSWLLISCHTHKESDDHHHDEESGHTEDQHGEHEKANSTMLTFEQMKSINIELGTIEKKQLTTSLKANGILKVPNQNKANVTALTGGIIKSILIQSGNRVAKGQLIATISNSAIITLQEEYLITSAKAILAELEVSRQKELHSGNAGALRNLQTAEAEMKSLNARKASLQKQLELIGINAKALTSENIRSIIGIHSPIQGSVSAVLVNIGSYVEANNPIAEIIDNGQLHLDLFVYEQDLSKLKIGQIIHFTLTNNPGKEYDAEVFSISNTFEQNTKAIAVHSRVQGNKTGLIDGMSITGLVSLNKATFDAVPTAAIVNHEGLDYIFIVTDPHIEDKHTDTLKRSKSNLDDHGHDHSEKGSEHKEFEDKQDEGTIFEKIPIRKGTTDVGYSEITLLKEIPANSKVVVNGSFFILAKMNNKGEGHTH